MNVPIPLKKAKINSALQTKSGRAFHCQSALLISKLSSIQFVLLYSTFLHERSMPMFHKLPPIKATAKIIIPQNTITAPRIFITIGAGAYSFYDIKYVSHCFILHDLLNMPALVRAFIKFFRYL